MVVRFPARRPRDAHPADRVRARRQDRGVHAALALVPGGGAELRVLEDDGTPARPVGRAIEQARESTDHVHDLERAARPRWILAAVAAGYPPLLRAGVRLARCHDLAATEALLLATEGDAEGAAGITAARAGA